jgi:hypothetical protein
MFLIPSGLSAAGKIPRGTPGGVVAGARILPGRIGQFLGHIVFIQGKGSMLIVIISIKHFKEVTHEKDFQRNPV